MRILRVTMMCASVALTGCAGVFTPIGKRLDPPQMTYDSIDNVYSHPLQYAYARVDEWDRAVQNIQGANVGATSALTALSGALVYRAARNKTGVATGLLAAGGLVGLSLSDALVQVGRLNAYEKGTAAMECAIYAYKGAGGMLGNVSSSPSASDSDATFNRKIAATPDLLEFKAIHDDNERVAQALFGTLDEPFGRTVSRITHEVHDALMSSIVTLQSKESSWTFTVPQKPAPAAVEKAQELKRVLLEEPGAAPISKTANVVQIEMKNGNITDDQKLAFLEIANRTIALDEAATKLAAVGPSYLQKLDACSIATPVASASGTSQRVLAIAPVKSGLPMSVAQGLSAAAIIEGGLTPYKAAMVESGAKAAGVSVDLSQDGGANVITVSATKTAKVDDVFTVVVTDSSKATVTLQAKVVKP